MDIYNQITNAQGIGEGNKGAYNIAGGSTIQELTLIYPWDNTAGAEFLPDHFEQIEFKLGTSTIINVTGLQLLMIQDYLGIHTENGRIVLPFKELLARSYAGYEDGGLVTYPGEAINLHVKIKGTGAGADATDVQLKGRFTPGVDGNGTPLPRRVVPKILTQTFNVNSAGFTTLEDVDFQTAHRIHFPSADMDGLQIWDDQTMIFDMDKTDADFEAKRMQKVPQAGYYHFDPVYDNWILAKSLTNKPKLKIKPHFAAGTLPQQVDMLIESIDTVLAKPAVEVASQASQGKPERRSTGRRNR